MRNRGNAVLRLFKARFRMAPSHAKRELSRMRWTAPITIQMLIALSACHPWYLVESEFHGETLDDAPPESTRTSEFTRAATPGVSVALSAPDRCADQSAAATTGE